ncbi:unnamed protein product [Acanthoscelides obtectus]|uniref:Uncharacterized protein n=1 Tax=Acanthoscelides obtectus TaxID=200917 RepID=A0A9P0L9Y6_ACAOB|nr:unnamed protein product [Acanthoscelides obtectus]CAK1675944.1 hypothetical protein AOBTE_LOCUS30504 [Acanthoscelides obtectus]
MRRFVVLPTPTPPPGRPRRSLISAHRDRDETLNDSRRSRGFSKKRCSSAVLDIRAVVQVNIRWILWRLSSLFRVLCDCVAKKVT